MNKSLYADIPEQLYNKLREYCFRYNITKKLVVMEALNEFLANGSEYSPTVSPSLSPSTHATETPSDDETTPPLPLTPKKEPLPVGLSGKRSTCTFCHESVPVELALKHYNDKHEGL